MIYFIRGKDSGNIKIGYSMNPEKRKANLQTAHYEDLEFLGIMDGTPSEEYLIKEKFSAVRIRGEWFKPTSELLDFIEHNKNAQTNIVSSLGNGEYRITFSRPLEFTMNFFLLAGTHKIRVMSDQECTFVFGIEGKRETLLAWFESLQFVTRESLDGYASLMVD